MEEILRRLEAFDSTDLASAIGERLGDDLQTGQLAARRHLFAQDGDARQILHLTVFQNIGRSFSIAWNTPPDDRCLQMHLSAEELEVISWLPRQHQLTLWQFARARHRMGGRAGIAVFDTLDEYGFYRAHQSSYYATDSGRPNLISISPGFARALRCEAYDYVDRLTLVHPRYRTALDFGNTSSERAIPIYCPLPGTGCPPCFVVRGDTVPIWVFVPDDPADPRYRGVYFHVADMLAYWVWRLCPALHSCLTEIGRNVDHLEIDVDLLPGEGWFNQGHGQSEDTTLRCVIEGRYCFRLTIGPGRAGKFATADNAGEREVIRMLLGGLRDWGRRHGLSCSADMTEDRISSLVDHVAPLGRQKKLLMFDAATNPALNDEGLLRYRPIQLFDRQELLDQMGEWVTGWFGRDERLLPGSDRVPLLNRLVGRLYQELEQTVAQLSPAGLLERLVVHCERVIFEQEHRRLTTPTRVACYGAQVEWIERLRRDLSESATTALANRFLIEYVTAHPPSGQHVLSLSVFDRLLALAAEIIELGMISDGIHYGVSDRPCTVLASGRLAIGTGPLEAAIDDFHGDYTLGEIDRSHAGFDRHWRVGRPELSADAQRLVAQMNAAASEEFGFSLEELNHFLGGVVYVGTALDREPKSLTVTEFLDQLTAGLGWDRAQIDRAFNLFTLGPRAAYPDPPPGHDRYATYPWRFNRSLAYVRRPLLIRQSGAAQEVIWGNRTVRLAASFLTHLCTAGRLIARTRAMKQAMGAFHERDGHEFNDQIARLFREIPGLLVRPRVKKVGRLRIARPNGQDLGDIDVLVVDPIAREVIPVETKDLAVALTPPELRNELNRLFRSPDGSAGDVDRFIERVGWVRTHLSDVLRFVGITDVETSGWTVRPMLVLDRELISPFLARREGLEVLSARQLRERLIVRRTDSRIPDPPPDAEEPLEPVLPRSDL
jgi:hypothetical protein